MNAIIGHTLRASRSVTAGTAGGWLVLACPRWHTTLGLLQKSTCAEDVHDDVTCQALHVTSLLIHRCNDAAIAHVTEISRGNAVVQQSAPFLYLVSSAALSASDAAGTHQLGVNRGGMRLSWFRSARSQEFYMCLRSG
jgi:hypothetical protein